MKTSGNTTQAPQQPDQRRAVVSVELSIVLPVLMILVVGVVESCNLFYIKQSLTISAYEGARAAIVKDMPVSGIDDRSNQVLTDRGIACGAIVVTPTLPSSATYGSYITVRAEAPYNSNSLIPGWLFGGITLRSSVKMMKEY